MKRKLQYYIHKERVEKEVTYIPVRFILAILLTVFEVLAIMGIVVALCRYVPYFYLMAWATEIACVITIIASDDNPDYKVPWLLFVLIIPVAGFMLYFLFYSRKLKRKYQRRLRDLKSHAYQKDDSELFAKLQAEDPIACSQAKMLTGIAETHLFANTKQSYFALGEEMHPAMLADLEKAEKFIFL